MGFYVHVQLSFTPRHSQAEAVRSLVDRWANEHLEYVEGGRNDEDFFRAIAEVMDPDVARLSLALKRLDKRTGDGPKGSVFSFGFVGNYSRGERIAGFMGPLFEKMFKENVGCFRHDHIILFTEPEQSERAECHEFFLDNEEKSLIVRHHYLPFCWGQF